MAQVVFIAARRAAISSQPGTSRRRIWLGAAAIAVAAICIAERRWFTTNDITTGTTLEYPELTSRVYPASGATVRVAAVEACRALPRWRIVETGDADRPLQAEVRTLLFNFVDDVTVRFESLSERSTRVVIRSHSRVGKGDLGENARHIGALQAAMDARLAGITRQ